MSSEHNNPPAPADKEAVKEKSLEEIARDYASSFAAQGDEEFENAKNDFINGAHLYLIYKQQAERDAAELTRVKGELEVVKAEREWISVEDKLPIEGRIVLAINQFGHIRSTDWEKYTNHDSNWFEITFTHWMPLPEPPTKLNPAL